jgi:hypothetical protein
MTGRWPAICPDCGGSADEPRQAPEEGEEVGDLCTHPMHDGTWRSNGEPDHPVRIGIVEALDWIGEPCSPVQLAPCLGVKAGSVTYHYTVLIAEGKLALVTTHHRRGALERRYALSGEAE